MLPNKREFGVSAFKSRDSELTAEIGRSLSMRSTSVTKVDKHSSVSTRSPASAVKMRHTERITFSQTPPWWLAAGGLKCHEIPFWHRVLLMKDWFHLEIACFNSRAAPTKLLPLSE